MVLDNPKQEWNKRIGEVARLVPKLAKLRVIAAFNSNIDYIKTIDPQQVTDLIASRDAKDLEAIKDTSEFLDLKKASSEKEFLGTLAYSMRFGKATRIVGSHQLFTWLNSFFGKPDEKKLGGQAALMASQLRQLGAKTSIYLSALSIDQARLLDSSLQVPVAVKKKLSFKKPLQAVDSHALTHYNWVFEFKKGDSITIDKEKITATRDNRIIVAHETTAKPLFSKELSPLLPNLGKQLDLALLSGYHAIHDKYSDKSTFKEVCKQAAEEIKQLKKNPNLLVHVEFVPVEHDEIEKTLLATVAKEAHSLGMNETELVEALQSLGLKKEAMEIKKNECSTTIYRGAVALFRKLSLHRIHVHNLGYSIVILDKKKNPYKTRDSVFLASVAATTKSIQGKLTSKEVEKFSELAISEAGFNQLGVFESSIWDAWEKKKRKPISSLLRKEFMANGVFTEKDHYAVIVPGPIATSTKTTVGLGDVLSGVAIAAEAIL